MYDFELREREDENRAARTYDHLYHRGPVPEYWDEDFFHFVSRVYAKGDRVLDVGCGPGSLWKYWRRLPSPGQLVGVDLSEEMVAEARRRHPDGDFRVGRLHELPFASGSFDVVIGSSVLHHVPDDYLESALEEIARVLDEHGRLVGREPSSEHLLARSPGWFSGAIMSFRHLAYRLTRAREYPEPELGDHHHVPELDLFIETLGKILVPTKIEQRFAFSSFVLRVPSDRIAALARFFDEKLSDRGGVMFYYVAEKNYVTAADIAKVVDLARRDTPGVMSDQEFLAYLQAASEHLEEFFAPDGR